MSNKLQIILICGIPGSGKSEYCRWLESEKGFVHWEVDATHHIPLKKSRKLGKPIVIEWGFHPKDLERVIALQNEGAELWWFDGDRGAARQSFLKRSTVSLEAFEAQMERINKEWPRIATLVESHVIQAVEPGPSYTAYAEIFERMFGHE